jgi:hypothetical protein
MYQNYNCIPASLFYVACRGVSGHQKIGSGDSRFLAAGGKELQFSAKMTCYNSLQTFGRTFAAYFLNNLNGKEYYEYLDNFHWFYDPELDHKRGIKIKI